MADWVVGEPSADLGVVKAAPKEVEVSFFSFGGESPGVFRGVEGLFFAECAVAVGFSGIACCIDESDDASLMVMEGRKDFTFEAYGWIQKGVRKEIPGNTGRDRLNLSGSIDIITHKIVIQEDLTLNSESTIRFFQKIEEAYPDKKKIHVFSDNAPYYRNKAVKAYLEKSKICLHFLPPYSPNLNPIERLWKWMKERVIYNTYYEHFESFRQAVLGFFMVLSVAFSESELGQELRRKVRDKFRTIQAPASNF